MNVINRKHPEILESASGKNDCYVSVHEDRLYFTSTAAKRFGLLAGKYMQFLNDGSTWSFFQSDDKDGFLTIADTKENSNAVMVCNRALIRMILKSTKLIKGVRLYLLESSARQQDNAVVEILTHKTFDQIMKAV